MNDKCCGTCRHWGSEDDGWKRFRKCQEIRHDEHGESGDNQKSEFVADDESIFDDEAVVVDGSGYFAALKTQEDFYCSLWQPLPATPEVK
jgi:hypothetical protein